MIEVNAPDKTTRRRRGKTDAVDAEAAAHACCRPGTAAAKAGDGPVEMVRLFKLAKTSATKSRARRSTSSRRSWSALTRHCARHCRA